MRHLPGRWRSGFPIPISTTGCWTLPSTPCPSGVPGAAQRKRLPGTERPGAGPPHLLVCRSGRFLYPGRAVRPCLSGQDEPRRTGLFCPKQRAGAGGWSPPWRLARTSGGRICARCPASSGGGAGFGPDPCRRHGRGPGGLQIGGDRYGSTADSSRDNVAVALSPVAAGNVSGGGKRGHSAGGHPTGTQTSARPPSPPGAR